LGLDLEEWVPVDDLPVDFFHFTNHQSTINNQQSTINNQQSSIINHQSTIDNHQSSIINRQSSIRPSRCCAVRLRMVNGTKARGIGF
jgi:hypothetical protein